MAFSLLFTLAQGRQVKNGDEIQMEFFTVGYFGYGVRYDQKACHLLAFESDGAMPVPVVVAFWSAWQAFYPETEIREP